MKKLIDKQLILQFNKVFLIYKGDYFYENSEFKIKNLVFETYTA